MATVDEKDKPVTDFRPGDVVRMYIKIKEGDKIRTQRFEGTVIARKGQRQQETFTVRKVLEGCGVERIFPINSLSIEKLEVVKRIRARRAKLYYLRHKK